MEFTSSHVEKVTRGVDPIAALTPIGKKPGDRIDLVHAGPLVRERTCRTCRRNGEIAIHFPHDCAIPKLPNSS